MRALSFIARRLGAIVVIVCISAAPVYAEETPLAQFRQGQKLMRDGDLGAALDQFEQLRAAYPRDADYSLGIAQVLALQGRDDEALSELEDTTRLAPGYEDAWRLRHSILVRSPGADRLEELQALRQQAARRFPLATWWREAEDPAQWTVFVGAGHDDLSEGLPSWNNQFVETLYEKSGRYLLAARLGRDVRYDTADYSLRLAGNRTWSSDWFTGADVILADDAAFQADFGFGISAGRPFGDDWVATIGYRRKEYTAETVGSFAGTLEKYHGNFRFAYTANSSRLHGASSFAGHTLTSNWYFSDNASIGLTISTGKEAESLGNGQVLESDVSGLSLSGRYQLNARYGLQWWLGTHDQGDFYRRQFFGMAVSFKL